MNSRERVRNAIEFKEIDRIPLDMCFTIGAYNNMVKYFDGKFPEATACNIWQLTFPPKEFLQHINVDCIYLSIGKPSTQPDYVWGCDEYTTEFGLTMKKSVTPDGYMDYEPYNAPFADFTVEDLEEFPWPDPTDEAMYAHLEAQAKDWYETTDLAIVGYFGASIFSHACMLRGMEQWLVDMLIDREFADVLLEKLTTYYTQVYCTALERCGKYLEFIRTDNDDYGTQNGLMISRDTYREVMKPHMVGFYSAIKKKFLEVNPHGKLMKHSCGDVFDLVDEFIDLGIDMLDPVQPMTAGMKAEKLIPAYGGKIAFHGAIDTQHLLVEGTPAEVKEGVKKTMQGFAMPGGYIVAPAHHLQPDVPPENIMAISEAVMKYGNVCGGELAAHKK